MAGKKRNADGRVVSSGSPGSWRPVPGSSEHFVRRATVFELCECGNCQVPRCALDAVYCVGFRRVIGVWCGKLVCGAHAAQFCQRYNIAFEVRGECDREGGTE